MPHHRGVGTQAYLFRSVCLSVVYCLLAAYITDCEKCFADFRNTAYVREGV